MGLIEFLRQWPRGRLTTGVVVSVALHVALIAALVGGRLPMTRYDVKRGEPLIVELPKGDDSPPPGFPGAPEPRPAAPAPPAPNVAPVPPAPPEPKAVAKPAPRPEPARRPAEPPAREPERRVASAPPVPKDSDPPAPAPAPPAPAPAKPADAGAKAAEPAPRPPAERQVASAPQPASPPAPGAPDMLTALRRGSGGTGGRGEGRAGIEGEPIPLDSVNPKYTDYLDQVRRRIKEKWGFPCVKNDVTRQCEYKTTQLVIEFGIAKDGKVPFVTVLRSSGYPIYDDWAVNAVKLASPFPPIPDTFSKKGVPIHATFSYVVESSLANILR